MTGADPEIEEGAAYSKVGISALAVLWASGGMLSRKIFNMRLLLRLGRYNQAKVNGHWSLTQAIADSWCGRSRSTFSSESAFIFEALLRNCLLGAAV